jgi:hypothetical protein
MRLKNRRDRMVIRNNGRGKQIKEIFDVSYFRMRIVGLNFEYVNVE